MLSLSNVEVVYDGVILVLKGVSLTVGPGSNHRTARCQRRRQDHDAEGDLGSAACGTWPGHQRCDRA